MNTSKNLTVLTLLALTLALSCAPEKKERASTDISVGLFVALTGSQASYGQAVRAGAQAAVDEVNAGGGLLGRKVRLIAEDTQGKPEEAASVVTKLITRDHVIGLVGETGSSRTLAAAPIAQNSRVPLVSPASTNPEVTKKGDYIFRICFTDEYQGRALASFTRKSIGAKRVAILTDVRSDYSVGLADVFSKEFTRLGGTVVARQSYAEGDSDFRAQITAIGQAAPEALFVPGYYTDVGQIATQTRDLGLKFPLVGGDGWDSPTLLEIGGAALDGCFFASERASDETFRSKWKQRTGRDAETLNAQGYDATAVLLQAVRLAGKTDGPAVRDQLAKTKDFNGASGKITIGPDRNPIKPVAIVGIQGGKTALKEWIQP